jgi:hypothetical protein
MDQATPPHGIAQGDGRPIDSQDVPFFARLTQANPLGSASISSTASAGDPAARLDPLASPTLAALLAFQGDAAASEGLYRQLGATDGRSPPDPPREDRLLAALLAFRDAARRLCLMRRSDE